ncbi:enoyl-CoA hydratase-related protein [Polymorphum gilvum]|uniref:Enoyl-CoA hydratase / short chain enoyl-CoA hydratase n=1 Tax=Polymorphum gilvum (strain LMG 25793 / CGMCC 1.9160 / SL003B-26A1) TaxID=991905 RepID=F2J2M3_POLGS|nr:enoyl-CoA hydratase-related protein [Polymorphum gilvum]ADZ70937.1 Enoyl-CoA hydratase / short chain enoyl-CoA hydratase [Polymorphum gilvum SL003B-26A1]
MNGERNDDLVLTRVEADSGIATITLNRPKLLNAVDGPTAWAFLDAVRAVTARDDVRCIVLTGAGRAFVAGGDISAFGADPGSSAGVVHDILDALHPALLALRAGPAPVIAAVRGVAAGAGLSLALAADLVVAEEGARFVVAYDRIGTSPDCGATWFLPRKVGRARAMELMLLSQTLDAEAACAAGIVSTVVAPEDFEATVAEIAAKVARGPTRAFGAYRSLVDAACDRPLAAHLEAERASFVAMTATDDFREGVAAFLAKRAPEFKGR